MSNISKLVAAILMIVPVTYAQISSIDTTSSNKKDGIYWEERKIIATGIGSPNPDAAPAAQRPGALRAAKLLALRNAMEIVKGIYLNSTSTVENFMTTSDAVTTQVSGFVKGFQQSGRERYMSDGSVEVTMEIPLDGTGGMTEMLLGNSLNNSPQVVNVTGATDNTVFSGLIIDCKGLNIKPALSPRLLDEDGKEIYGSANVQKDWAVKYGIVGYSKTIENAAKIDRVGQHPGTLKAMKSSGKNNTDVILSNDNAEKVLKAAKNLKFLSECRVVFVID